MLSGAGKVYVIVAGRVDEGHPLGDRIHGSKDVHVAAGIFSQLAAGIHTAEVDHKGLFGDLVGLGTGEQAGGHAAQGRKALLSPEAAQRHGGTQEHREHPGHLAGNVVLLTALYQQPQQRQQRGQNDQIQNR